MVAKKRISRGGSQDAIDSFGTDSDASQMAEKYDKVNKLAKNNAYSNSLHSPQAKAVRQNTMRRKIGHS